MFISPINKPMSTGDIVTLRKMDSLPIYKLQEVRNDLTWNAISEKVCNIYSVMDILTITLASPLPSVIWKDIKIYLPWM
jgi:hypothetical protein